MSTIHTAPSVNPDTVTPDQIAAVFAEYGITPPRAVPDALESFFRPGATYRRRGDTFCCAAVGAFDGKRIAFGYLPINLGGVATWETAFMTEYDWSRNWKATAQ